MIKLFHPLSISRKIKLKDTALSPQQKTLLEMLQQKQNIVGREKSANSANARSHPKTVEISTDDIAILLDLRSTDDKLDSQAALGIFSSIIAAKIGVRQMSIKKDADTGKTYVRYRYAPVSTKKADYYKQQQLALHRRRIVRFLTDEEIRTVDATISKLRNSNTCNLTDQENCQSANDRNTKDAFTKPSD